MLGEIIGTKMEILLGFDLFGRPRHNCLGWSLGIRRAGFLLIVAVWTILPFLAAQSVDQLF